MMKKIMTVSGKPLELCFRPPCLSVSAFISTFGEYSIPSQSFVETPDQQPITLELVNFELKDLKVLHRAAHH